jgi:hypothetical protein
MSTAVLALGVALAITNPFTKLIELANSAPNLDKVTQTVLTLTTAIQSLSATLANADFSKLENIATPSLTDRLLNFGAAVANTVLQPIAPPVAPAAVGVTQQTQTTTAETTTAQSNAEVAGLLKEQNTLLTQILHAVGAPAPVQIGPKVIAELTSVINVENSYRRNR